MPPPQAQSTSSPLKRVYLLVNFGGPRMLAEVEPFLIELLTDQEVIRTPWPAWLHRLFFTRVAKKRARTVRHDYACIGGKSPIVADTEWIARALQSRLGAPVFTFHRYLPSTHAACVQQLIQAEGEVIVLPLFPQFSYATTGSIALWLLRHLPREHVERLRWIDAYPDERGYVEVMVSALKEYLAEQRLCEEQVVLLFSAHGLPQQFIDTGDPYEEQCVRSYDALRSHFPRALTLLSYQSQFGKAPWIRPYTQEVVDVFDPQGRRAVVVVPLSFTSDHIETLYEVEQLYLPRLRARGLAAYRCPALNLREDWIDVLAGLCEGAARVRTAELVRCRML